MTAGSSVACTRRSPRLGGVEHVFGDGGQIDLVVDGESALVAREDEQRPDEVLGVVDRGADVGCHAAQVAGVLSGLSSTTSTVARMTASGVRSSWRGVGDEPLLALERGLEPVEHLVERLGKFVELVAGTAQRDPRRQVVFRGGAGGGGDPVHGAQRAPGDDPAEDRGEGDDHRERDQRVLQEVREGDVALVLRALKLEVGVALGKERGRWDGRSVARSGTAPGSSAGACWLCPCGSSRATRM